MTDKNKQTKNFFLLTLTSSLGTILEWYDFSLYAYLSPIISSHFFPTKNPIASITLTYSVFAIGFLVRPIGALFFGHFGDRVGRKKVLIVTVSLMGVMTFLIGLLPTTEQIGLLAPFLLILFRIFQGFAIGGETIGAGSLVIESVPENVRGFSTAIIWASSGIGILLSSIFVSIASWIFTQDELSNWAWRIPFLFGALTGIPAYFLRINIIESNYFRSIKEKLVRVPFFDAIKNFKNEIQITFALYVLSAISTYLIFVFMPVYATKNLGLPFNKAMTINKVSMFLMVLFVPLVGYYSDIFGRRIILLSSAITFILLSFPLFFVIVHGSVLGLITAQLCFAILTAAFQGPITAAVLEMFPTHIRYSAAAFGYNLSYSIFGGTTPVIAIYLITSFKNSTAPSLYLIFGAIIAAIGTIKMRETFIVPLRK